MILIKDNKWWGFLVPRRRKMIRMMNELLQQVDKEQHIERRIELETIIEMVGGKYFGKSDEKEYKHFKSLTNALKDDKPKNDPSNTGNDEENHFSKEEGSN